VSDSVFQGTILASSIVTCDIDRSLALYREVLGFQLLDKGQLNTEQKEIFGEDLSNYLLLGHDRGSIIRLLDNNNPKAIPLRQGASPWDPGLAVLEAGTNDVDKIYFDLIRNRFGVISQPKEFSVEGPEPLGYLVMRAVGVMGPSGEQLFLTQIKERAGGTPLWEQRQDINVLPPANVVLSLEDHATQVFYKEVFDLEPSVHLLLAQVDAAQLMGGPDQMSFDMCLMGNGNYKSGMEQHIYSPHNPDFTYQTYPCDFSKTGFASACWGATAKPELEEKIIDAGGQILGHTLLPLRDCAAPKGLVYQGPIGEIIELYFTSP